MRPGSVEELSPVCRLSKSKRRVESVLYNSPHSTARNGGRIMSKERFSLRDYAGIFQRDLKYAVRSLSSAKGLTLTVILTLALGIGANAAIFTLVRGVLLRPLVNRDEDKLVYIRQSAPGLGDEDTAFSVP